MAKKELTYKGKSAEELRKLSISELAALMPSRQRRSLKRGFTEQQKKLIKKIRAGKNNVETHCRDLIILPEMIDRTIKVHNGKEFIPVMVTIEMVSHYLGEFVQTRRKVIHHAPGIGATRSSASLSVR